MERSKPLKPGQACLPEAKGAPDLHRPVSMKRIVRNMRSEKKKRKTTAVFLLSCTLFCSVFPVQADEIIVGNDSALEEEDVPDDVADAAEEDASELFVDTGNDVVSRKGETLDEAMEEDSGMTVNTGHLYEINGVPVRNSDFPSELNECWAYANNLYAKIWGHNFQGYADDSENMLRNLPDEELTLTPEHLKAYVSAAPAGAALRICNEDYLHGNDIGGHSQIIISHDENGFTVFEGGLQTWPHRREAYYTWDGFCYGWPGKYHYIKYVKWPGAFPWERGMTVDHAQDPDALLKQVFRNLAQIVSDMIRGNVNRKELNRDNSICSPASLPPAVYSGRSVLH